MIDQKTEHIYDIILSISLALFVVYVVNKSFVKPRIDTIYLHHHKKNQ